MTEALEKVFEPIRLGGVTVPNRIVRSAAATNFGGPYLTDELIDFEESHARGGAGLIIIGDASVHPTTPAPLLAYDDRIIEGFEKLVRRVRPYGTRLFQQLWYSGSPYPNPCGGPPWSSSPVPSPMFGVVPLEMDDGQIEEIINGFAESARRCEKGGLDGIEVHGGHGYIFQQFLSPLTNQRQDRYGGTFENRIRFTCEVLAAIRQAVSPSFAVGIRISTQGFPNGLTEEDLIPLEARLREQGLADFLNISHGSYAALNKVLGSMYEPSGYQLQPNSTLLRAAKLPRIVNGRFTSLAEAESVLREGLSDMVGITRGMIAEPDLVAKTRADRASEVRPCIACNEGCIGDMATGPITCTVNPVVGRESEVAAIVKSRVKHKKVLVVGGGPAGMEAARSAAERGHEVTLADAAPQLGGQLHYARRAAPYARLGAFVDWQAHALDRLPVGVLLGSAVDEAFIDTLKPDVLIIATGSRPRGDGVQYSMPTMSTPNTDQIFSSWDVLDRRRPLPPGPVLIIDETGHHEAVAVGAYLLSEGRSITFVTALDEFAPTLSRSVTRTPVLEFLADKPVCYHMRTLFLGSDGGKAQLKSIDGGRECSVDAGTIIAVTPNLPVNGLSKVRRPGLHVHTIGDALSPRLLGAAVGEGFQAGLAIGSDESALL